MDDKAVAENAAKDAGKPVVDAAALQAKASTEAEAAERQARVAAEHGDMADRLNGLVEGLAERGFELPAEGEATAQALAVIDKLKAENAALTKKLTTAQNKAKAVPSTEKGRKIGPIKDKVEGRSDDDGTVAAEHVLLEMIREADKVEVAFSDGARELAGIPALVVTGDAWAITAAGLKLTIDPIPVTGFDKPYELRGYGLVLDGKQVAWRDTEPRRILPGSQWNLAGDIVFTG